jgi:hypothetical protein
MVPLLSVAGPVLLVLLGCYPGACDGWTFKIGSSSDLICTGGAGFSNFGGPHNMRSGSPSSHEPLCRISSPAGGVVSAVSFKYRYAAGYGCTPDACANPPAFSVVATDQDGTPDAGGPLYTSPALDQHSGDAGQWHEDAYSPPIEAKGSCTACTGSYLAFKFVNHDHNIQILLPIELHIDAHEVGWGLTGVLFGCLIVYVVGGLAWVYKKEGRVSGLGAHPHAKHWREVRGPSDSDSEQQSKALPPACPCGP